MSAISARLLMPERATAFEHWTAIDGAIDELDLIRGQLIEARRQSRTIRFYEILLAHPSPSQRTHVGDAVELSEGWCIVHWALTARRPVDFYQSVDRLRAAMAFGGAFILSLVDISERDATYAPRASQTRGALTAGERNVLGCLSHGATDKEISVMTGRSVQTVKNQLGSVYRKLDVTGRMQAALLARDLDMAA